jgi:hypothetical protein
MSGLFGTLIDAARGTAPAIMQRPRQHFASFEAVAPLQEVEEEARSEQAPRSRIEPREFRGETSLSSPRVDEERRWESPRGSEATSAREPETRTGPSTRQFLPAAELEPAVPRTPPNRPADTRPLLLGADAELPPGRDTSAPPEARDPVATHEMKLLLPELARPAVPDAAGEAGELGRPLFAPEPSARTEAGSKLARVELMIGRIEVAAPKTRLAAPHTARPVVVPRAKPRQTLDDYLSRRRK